eukprot:6154617-Pleurochrysis_carterae.AAC.2
MSLPAKGTRAILCLPGSRQTSRLPRHVSEFFVTELTKGRYKVISYQDQEQVDSSMKATTTIKLTSANEGCSRSSNRRY